MTFTENRKRVYTAVYLFGGGEAIGSAKSQLEAAGFRLGDAGGYGLVLANVLAADLPSVEAVAADHGLTLEAFGEKEVTSREAAPKPFKLNLEPGKWYWADNLEDSTPLIYVKDVAVQADSQVLTLEYLAPEGLPVPVTVDSREVVEYGFRPATVEDFERYDLVAPDHTYLVPKMAKVEEVSLAKPKSANAENFKQRQKKVADKSSLMSDIDQLEDEIDDLESYLQGLEEEANAQDRWEELSPDMDSVAREMEDLIEDRAFLYDELRRVHNVLPSL